MPHVFDYENNTFVQMHYAKVPQRPSNGKAGVIKRQRNQEYIKFLLKGEKERGCKEVEKKD